MYSLWFAFIIFSHTTPKVTRGHVRIRMSERCAHKHKRRTPTLIQKSLNMYLLLITLEINSSGSAVTGACCYWQTALVVTDNMRYLSILHCNPPIYLSPSLSLFVFFLQTFPSLSRSASPSSALLSPSVRWVEKWHKTKTFVTPTIHRN